jgi:hypothetical protein
MVSDGPLGRLRSWRGGLPIYGRNIRALSTSLRRRSAVMTSATLPPTMAPNNSPGQGVYQRAGYIGTTVGFEGFEGGERPQRPGSVP